MSDAKLVLDVESRSVNTATNALGRLSKQSKATELATKKLSNVTVGSMAKGALAIAGVTSAIQILRASISGAVTTMVQFEDSLAAVGAVTRASDKEMLSLEKTARSLGATTRFSASQAAEGMRFLGMAGFETSDIIEAMPGLLDLAVAGALELGSAADITSNIMSGFGLEAEEAARVADVLAGASSSANTNVEQLGEGMKFVAPVAAALGISVEDTAAAMGVLSDAGLQGSMAGTGLRRVLSELANTTPQAQKALESYGLTVEQLNPATTSITEIVNQLAEVGLDATDAFTIFGDRGAPAILALTSQTTRLGQLTNEFQKLEGRAKEMADVMGDTLSGDLKILRSSVEELVLSLNEELGLTESLRSATQAATEFIRGISGDSVERGISGTIARIDELNERLETLGEGRGGRSRVNINNQLAFLDSQLSELILNATPEQLEREGKILQNRIASIREEIANPKEKVVRGKRRAKDKVVRLSLPEDELQAELARLETQQSQFNSIVESQQERFEQSRKEATRIAAEKEEKIRKEKEAQILSEKRVANNQTIQSLENFLKTEEELIRDSYNEKINLAKQNIIDQEEQNKLIKQLEIRKQEDLANLQNTGGLENKLESIRKGLLTEQEALEQSYEDRKQIILESTFETEQERQNLLSRLENEFNSERRRLQIDQWKQATSAFSDFQDNMAILAGTGSKKLAAIYKASAIANTIIKTYESAQNAFASLSSIPYVGPALGAAAAGAAIAAGMARVQAIKSQPVGSYEQGGIVPGSSFTGDKQTANVNSGEMILTRSQQANMFNQLNGRGARTDKNQATQAVYVNVENNVPQAQVEVLEQPSSDGSRKEISILISKIEKDLSSKIQQGGNTFAKSLENTYSLKRGAR